MPPPPSEKLLVLGGNGFVGSHVCKEALEHGLSVASLSRNVLLELRFTLNAVGNQLGDWNQDQVNPCIWNSVSCDNNQNVVTL
ncbi:uncharacterized protein A4U43_C04F9340 [Asparagus officinalis]|uniref:Leucine-rich repeat-containing N-terminal plant-type domain-containing protein n=1 Tax=Asparagus officinalis TaxID=4686 RepID=A0A5P1EZI7_ASPOF|nr:uncharacterized protein A4U43_C04F9340 [Asparagus officinalis]